MGKRVILANSSLEKTIDKILDQTEQTQDEEKFTELADMGVQVSAPGLWFN